MAIRRICSRHNKGYTCLSCGEPLNGPYRDNTITTCRSCGQGHFTDVYIKIISFTAVEHPEIRRRNINVIPAEAREARKNLIRRAEGRER